MSGPKRSGSRFLYEPFDSAHARIEVLERVMEARWAALERRLEAIESALQRLEKRMWLAVYGIATALLGQIVYSSLASHLTP